VYAHLGLHAPIPGAPLRAAIGAPTTLTLIRGSAAGLLWGHLIAGRPVSRGQLGTALGLAGATDIADGALARARGQTTRLGAYLDAEADLSFGLAAALTLAARRWLPRWLVAVMVARWLVPFALACASYLGALRPVALTGTPVGKVASLAQTAVLGVALLPVRRSGPVERWRPALHLAAAALLVAAPLSQILRVLRAQE
jgi:phosphatidylglycerophosphate synthase